MCKTGARAFKVWNSFRNKVVLPTKRISHFLHFSLLYVVSGFFILCWYILEIESNVLTILLTSSNSGFRQNWTLYWRGWKIVVLVYFWKYLLTKYKSKLLSNRKIHETHKSCFFTKSNRIFFLRERSSEVIKSLFFFFFSFFVFCKNLGFFSNLQISVVLTTFLHIIDG